MGKIIIAIDGYSATGKSSTAKTVAHHLSYNYIDSGAMYRAATLYFLRKNISLIDPASIYIALKNINIELKKDRNGFSNTYLNGQYVEKEIRGLEVSENVSAVSALKPVREAMVAKQKIMGLSKGIVMDGRDIGSTVFPKAELKIFMTASPKIRAKRRQKDFLDKGKNIAYKKILENILVRDKIDSTRKESPLVKVKDAIEVDSSTLSFQDQVKLIIELAKTKIVDCYDH